jgi:ABC-type sugar transport system substrate-binding protein
MGEEPELLCEECEEPLTRVFSIPLNYKIKEAKKKVGDVVKSYIEDSREDLKNQVREMKENR